MRKQGSVVRRMGHELDEVRVEKKEGIREVGLEEGGMN